MYCLSLNLFISDFFTLHIIFTFKWVNGWLCHLEIYSHTPYWIWSNVCKQDNNIMVPKCSHLLHTLPVYVCVGAAGLNSALCDSGTRTRIVRAYGVQFRKLKSTLCIWILCSDVLDLFLIKDAFILRQTSGRGLNMWGLVERVWAPTTTPGVPRGSCRAGGIRTRDWDWFANSNNIT